jgi:predicted secreted protein
MSTAAKSAWGAKLQTSLSDASYVSITELNSISGPSQKAKAIDVTNMDSTAAFAEYIAGIVDGGTIQIDGNWNADASQVANFLTFFQARDFVYFKILLPGTQPAAGYWKFQGYITEHAMDMKVQDRITWKATIQVTGEPVFATV